MVLFGLFKSQQNNIFLFVSSLLNLNGQVSFRYGQNDYFDNRIKFGLLNWKFLNLRDQNKNNSKL